MTNGENKRDVNDCEKFKSVITDIKNIVPNNYIESDEVINNVYSLREYWKPDKELILLLLAESHVWTDINDYCNEAIIPDCINQKYNLTNYPKNYSRFVNCVGYGENHLFNQDISRNSGTPQYWKLLYKLMNKMNNMCEWENINVLKSVEKNMVKRLKNKINLLQ